MASQTVEKPIGLIVASHCGVATEMLKAAELIVGTMPACRAISMDPDQSVDDMTRRLADAIKDVDQGAGVLILTDLYGGTPTNISLSFMSPKVEILCGINLPMLIKFVGCRKANGLKETARILQEYGKQHISLASDVLSPPAQKNAGR